MADSDATRYEVFGKCDSNKDAFKMPPPQFVFAFAVVEVHSIEVNLYIHTHTHSEE